MSSRMAPSIKKKRHFSKQQDWHFRRLWVKVRNPRQSENVLGGNVLPLSQNASFACSRYCYCCYYYCYYSLLLLLFTRYFFIFFIYLFIYLIIILIFFYFF